MMHTRRHTYRAMATAFEFLLCGDDAEHLDAVAAAASDELARIERLLSRFDLASEVFRLNSDAAARPVRVNIELFDILRDCTAWHEKTEGFFDITAAPSAKDASRKFFLDEASHTVRLADADTRLDFGGYGKGYALDCIACIVKQFGVASAVLHGGTSSVLTLGHPPAETGWPIGLRDPWDHSRELLQVRLSDRGLSSSAALTRVGEESDIIIPHSGSPLAKQAGCVVVASNATVAEVLSTALLAMGKSRAMEYIGSHAALFTDVSVGWIESRNNQGDCQWLTPMRM